MFFYKNFLFIWLFIFWIKICTKFYTFLIMLRSSCENYSSPFYTLLRFDVKIVLALKSKLKRTSKQIESIMMILSIFLSTYLVSSRISSKPNHDDQLLRQHGQFNKFKLLLKLLISSLIAESYFYFQLSFERETNLLIKLSWFAREIFDLYKLRVQVCYSA